jgi:hypothetical protein
LVTRKFGADLKEGHIIAANSERGTQAGVLTPGWNFGYWPWNYAIESVKNMDIPADNVGVVLAKDGKDLPAGEVYAPEWVNPQAMIDGDKFMKEGYRGPQLTVLPPGQYRYNPKLFSIASSPCLNVKVGEVAVIKANAGLIYTNKNVISDVNAQLVPKGYRGIWNQALTPNKYYLHPGAYEPVMVKTIKRVYTYTGKGTVDPKAGKSDHDNSITVRSKDGFTFPVDTRVTVIIPTENAPFAVARFGDPDGDPEKDGFEAIETIAILPSIRAILRNSAQDQEALKFVNSRSEVEKEAYNKVKADLEKDKIEVEAVYLADIGVGDTAEGKELLKTQTDTQLALQQIAQYKQQQAAEMERANQVKAREQADLQKQIQASVAEITVSSNKAEAAINEARGKAAAYEQQIKALGGFDNLVKMELGKAAIEKIGGQWKGDVPSMVISGGSAGGGSLTDVMTGVFAQQLKAANTPATK